MEFTYQGMVRYGYGFDNPNHAAALIVMLLPLLWTARMSFSGRKRLTIPLLLIEIALYIALVLTYSRTGFLALAGGFAVFYGLHAVLRFKRRNETRHGYSVRHAVTALFGLTMFIGIASYSGAAARYFSWLNNPDRSILNRFVIWNGAARMLADNPHGVGGGLSGEVFTAFYCPSDKNIVCRTMINSFITLLVERGIVFAVFWGALLLWSVAMLTILAVSNDVGRRRRLIALGALSSLTAGIVSGCASTCFDVAILSMPLYSLNHALQSLLWMGLAAPVVAAIITTWRTASLHRILIASAAALSVAVMAISAFYCWGKYSATETRSHVFTKNDSVWIRVMVKPDGTDLCIFPDREAISDRQLLKVAKTHLPEFNPVMPLGKFSGTDGAFETDADHIALCGKFVSQVGRFRDRSVVLILPHIMTQPLPERVIGIYLLRYDVYGVSRFWQRRAEDAGLPETVIRHLDSH